MEHKINLLKDKEDYKRELTKDKIFNITGEKGSGKTTFGSSINEKESIVIHLDWVFDGKGEFDDKEENDSKKVREILLKKYKDLDIDKYFESKYYDEIVNYIKKSKKTGYIEGNAIAEIKDISKIKGTIIVKRTPIIKCFIRVVKRDYKNPYFRKGLNRVGLIKRFFHVVKRRKKMFKSYKNIEKFIQQIEDYLN